jgi:hypothetical protein
MPFLNALVNFKSRDSKTLAAVKSMRMLGSLPPQTDTCGLPSAAAPSGEISFTG